MLVAKVGWQIFGVEDELEKTLYELDFLRSQGETFGCLLDNESGPVVFDCRSLCLLQLISFVTGVWPEDRHPALFSVASSGFHHCCCKGIRVPKGGKHPGQDLISYAHGDLLCLDNIS